MLMVTDDAPFLPGNSVSRGWCDNRLSARSDLAAVMAPEMEKLSMERRQVTPKHNLPTPEMIAREGYPAETHMVETTDGYRLTLHR